MVVGVSVPTHFDKCGAGGFGLATAGLSENEFDLMWKKDSQEITKIIKTFDKYARKNHIAQIYPLTKREKQVLELCVSGLNTSKIAHELGNSSSTVEKQIRSAKNKLMTRNNEKAVAKALLLGII